MSGRTVAPVMAFRTLTEIRTTLLMLAGLALCLQAMVPAGFMPDMEGTGRYITICSGIDQKIVYMPGETDTHHSGGESCVFALIALSHVPLENILPASVGAPVIIHLPAVISFPMMARLSRAHLATGPPSIL